MDALSKSPSPRALFSKNPLSRQERFRQFCHMGIRKVRGLLATIFIFVCLVGAAFVASTIEALSYLLVRPISLGKHRRVCLILNHAFLLCSTFLLERWSGVTFRMYGDRIVGDRSHLCIINHHSDVDWLLGLAFIAKLGFPYPGNAKSVVKASLSKVPLFGTILRFAEFAFLTRSWKADRETFLKSLLSLRGYTKSCSPFWFTLYPEGTRLTQEKLERSQAYAVSRHVEPLSNVLFPRFKAFTTIVPTLRDEFDGIVDATLMFEGDVPSMKNTLSGTGKSVVHAHVKYYPMKDIPEGEEQLEKWLLDRWCEKDKLIASFKSDPKNLGTSTPDFFPVSGSPNLGSLYTLVASYFVGAAATMYLFSKIPNGISILLTLSVAATILTAVFTALNVKTSRKGAKKRSPANRVTST